MPMYSKGPYKKVSNKKAGGTVQRKRGGRTR